MNGVYLARKSVHRSVHWVAVWRREGTVQERPGRNRHAEEVGAGVGPAKALP